MVGEISVHEVATSESSGSFSESYEVLQNYKCETIRHFLCKVRCKLEHNTKQEEKKSYCNDF
jgi:hypothetical protein